MAPHRREELSSAAFDHAPVALVHFDADGQIKVANGACVALFGSEEASAEGASIAEVLHEGDRAHFRAICASLRTDQPAQTYTRPRPPKNGLYAWVLRAHDEEKGSIFASIEYVENPTAFQRLNLRGDAILEKMAAFPHELITVLNPDTSILYESDAIEQMMGYAPDELVGRPAADLIHPEDRQILTSLFEEMRRKRTTMEKRDELLRFRWRHRDGYWVHLESEGTLLTRNGEVHAVLILSRDVTHWAKRIDTLESMRDALRGELSSHAPEQDYAFWESNPPEITSTAFPPYPDTIAIAHIHDESGLRLFRPVSSLTDERLEQLAPLVKQSLEEGTLELDMDEDVLIVPLSMSWAALCCEISTQDALAPLLEAYPRTPALLQLFDHELRTPLNNIRGYAELMLEEIDPTSTRDLEKLYRATRRLQRLLDNLVELSRIEQGDIDIHLERVTPQGLLSELEEYTEVALFREDLSLELTHNLEDGVTFYTDRTRLLDSLSQLVSFFASRADKLTIALRAEGGEEIWTCLHVAGYSEPIEALEAALEQAEHFGMTARGREHLDIYVCARRFELLGGTLSLHRPSENSDEGSFELRGGLPAPLSPRVSRARAPPR